MIRSLLLTAALLAAPAAHAQAVAITGGKVVTNTGAGIIENGTVVINNGRVVSVSTAQPPANAKVIDARGKWVTPGLFAAFSRAGLSEIDAEDSADDVSAPDSKLQISLHAADAFNPDDTAIPVSRIEGVTRLALVGAPGEGIFGGYGALADTSGTFDSLQNREAFMFAQFGDSGAAATGGSRAALWAWLAAAIDDAKSYPRGFGDDRQGDVLSRREAAALKPIVDGKIPLMVEAHRASDLLQIIALQKREPKMKLIILGAAEGWRVANELAAAKIPVIVNPLTNLPDRFEILAATLENAGRLSAAGVQVAIADPGDATHNTRFIQQLAGNAAANGMTWDAAFAAITRVPATIHGRNDLGVLQAGATADVVIWDGDPLELMSSPDAVYINGVETSLVSRQTKLRDRYLNLNETVPQAYERSN
ncbi:MAG: amidohydrolase family protein [Hyphomonadaceae bacterium]|nr:amidohydrolase family protein [Hyphomonadaceae bacterium]